MVDDSIEFNGDSYLYEPEYTDENVLDIEEQMRRGRGGATSTGRVNQLLY